MQNNRPDEPAFPTGELNNDGSCLHASSMGMSLRDYFAAKALSGFCADPSTGEKPVGHFAKCAYRLADAMMEARKTVG